MVEKFGKLVQLEKVEGAIVNLQIEELKQRLDDAGDEFYNSMAQYEVRRARYSLTDRHYHEFPLDSEDRRERRYDRFTPNEYQTFGWTDRSGRWKASSRWSIGYAQDQISTWLSMRSFSLSSRGLSLGEWIHWTVERQRRRIRSFVYVGSTASSRDWSIESRNQYSVTQRWSYLAAQSGDSPSERLKDKHWIIFQTFFFFLYWSIKSKSISIRKACLQRGAHHRRLFTGHFFDRLWKAFFKLLFFFKALPLPGRDGCPWLLFISKACSDVAAGTRFSRDSISLVFAVLCCWETSSSAAFNKACRTTWRIFEDGVDEGSELSSTVGRFFLLGTRRCVIPDDEDLASRTIRRTERAVEMKRFFLVTKWEWEMRANEIKLHGEIWRNTSKHACQSESSIYTRYWPVVSIGIKRSPFRSLMDGRWVLVATV